MRTIDLSKESAKFLSRMQPKHAKQIAQTLQRMQENPYPHDSEQLRGYPFFRVDSGEYRIVYEVEEKTLRILLIGKRNDDDVYKKPKRK